MLISPMLFFFVARALLVARRAGAIRTGRSTVERGGDGDWQPARILPAGNRRSAGPHPKRLRGKSPALTSVAAAPSSLRRTHQMQDAAIVPCLRPARAQGDQRAMKTGSAGLQESVEAPVPASSASAAIRHGRRHDPVRERCVGRRPCSMGRGRPRQGKARSAAGERTGDGKM